MSAGPRRDLSVPFAVAWVAYFTALQWSVVRFEVAIVAVLSTCALGLGLWLWRRGLVMLTPRLVAVMLVCSALATLVVPLFSYLEGTGLAVARAALVAVPLVVAALLLPGREGAASAALATVTLGYLAVGALAILTDPAPTIDVWVSLQQASDALARGISFYEVTWIGSPGVADAFTYLPWTAVLLAPGRWILGDVRWALMLWTLVATIGVWALAQRAGDRAAAGDASGIAGATGSAGRAVEPDVSGHSGGSSPGSGHGPRWRAAAVIALLLLAPGTLTQLDQAWTEPLLFAGIVWWAALVDRDRAWWAIVPLALACASKQHLVLLLPLLLVWRPFGVHRTLATGALAGILIAPWFLAGPEDFLHDTVWLLVSFHAIRFANTLYLLALNVGGVALPFWLTGLVVLGVLLAAGLVIRRRQPGLAEMLRWLALVLLVANLVNKQAFFNQYWLVGALVVASLAVRPGVLGARDVGPRMVSRGMWAKGGKGGKGAPRRPALSDPPHSVREKVEPRVREGP